MNIMLIVRIVLLLHPVMFSGGDNYFTNTTSMTRLFSSLDSEFSSLNVTLATDRPDVNHTKEDNSGKEELGPTTPVSLKNDFIDRVYTYWYYVGGIVCTVFSIFGVVGNILSIITLSSPEMQSSTSIFLILLAVFDSILLVSNALFTNITWLLLYTPHRFTYKYFLMLPRLPILYALSSISHTGSIYTIVAVNVERYVAVCRPLKAASLCTMSKARKTCIGIVLFCLIYDIPRYMEMYWTWRWVPELNQTLLLSSYSDMAYTFEYLTVYSVYINAAVKLIIPATALVVLNTFMVRTIRKTHRTRLNLQKQEKKDNQTERFTAMVLAVFVVFMLSLTAAFAELILFEANGAMKLEECSEICGYVSGISQMVVNLNSAINFVLFCFFGRKFRGVFAKKYLLCSR